MWWNSVVEKWNSDSGTVEQCGCNSEIVIVEKWNSDGGTVLVDQ